jgi:gamma-glutamyltranspeptidase / glutathione hydrolase
MLCFGPFRSAAALLAGLLLLAAPAGAAAPAPAASARGMVASPQADATRAGAAVLAAGGNAVDAAIAVSFALGVTDPHHSGIGGGGFLLLRLADGRAVAIDARETAPGGASKDMYLAPGIPERASQLGALSVGTPGLVKGLALAHERYATKPWAELLAPAIRLAEEGFAVGPSHASALGFWQKAGLAARFPETAAIQLPAGGAPIRPGFRLVQAELAGTLRSLAAEGAPAFYEGALAQAMAAEVQRRGGLLSTLDLALYEAKLREVVRGEYRGLEVLSFPPPSSGGVALVEMLNVLEGFPLAERGAGSAASGHLIAEAMKLAFADRNAFLGDPDFVDVPVAGLVSKEYAAALRGRINPPRWRRAPWRWGSGEVALHVEGPGEPPRGGGTTHFSVADAAGNAVAVTQTINLILGSGITVPGTGIVMNDEMDDFSIAPGTPNAFGLVDTTGANAVAPGKRPLSSMTPTILVKGGRPFMVTGSPGGPRIITTTLLTILNVVDYGMDASEAVAAPRIHHQWLPDVLEVEPGTVAEVIQELRRRGHEVKVSDREWSSAQVIVVDPATGLFTGASDPRSDGLALGPGGSDAR